jgi:SAM-dependent methyltransferase
MKPSHNLIVDFSAPPELRPFIISISFIIDQHLPNQSPAGMYETQYNGSMAEVTQKNKFELQFNALFRSFYNYLVGVHPRTRISHPQYLVNENLRGIVERNFIFNCKVNKYSNVLDVGCGLKPYSYILPEARWFGIDVYDGPKVDLVIDGTNKWDIPNDEFDAVLCTEVLEHAISPQLVIQEIWRVLKPGGFAIVTTPFIYGIHGEPDDFRRYTPYGLIIECRAFEVVESGLLGGIGSSIVININNWISLKISKLFVLNFLLIPIFLLHCILINIVGKVFDRLDNTSSFGTNSWVLLKKAPDAK